MSRVVWLAMASIFVLLISGPASAQRSEEIPGDSVFQIEGEWIQGGLLVGKVDPGYRLTLNDQTVYVDQDGMFVLGLSRDFPETARIALSFRSNLIQEMRFDVIQREYDIQSITGIPQTIMQPSAEDQERIQREAIRVAKARETFLPDKNFLQGFVVPAEGPITGVYGSQRIYNDVPGTPHYGIDYAGPTGAPVIAPAPGLVILAEPDLFYSGGTLIIDHGYGVSSTFLHLSELDVAVGERVTAGDLIGKIGATGRATGPHLDWRMNWRKVRIDPQLLLDSPPRSPLN